MDGDSWQVLTLIDVFHVGGVPLWTFWIVIYLLLGTQSRALSLELLKFPALKVGDQRRQVGPIVSTVAQKGSALHWPPRNGRGPQMLCSTHAHRHAYFTYISFMFVLFLFSYYVRAVSATNVIWVDAFFLNPEDPKITLHGSSPGILRSLKYLDSMPGTSKLSTQSPEASTSPIRRWPSSCQTTTTGFETVLRSKWSTLRSLDKEGMHQGSFEWNSQKGTTFANTEE